MRFVLVHATPRDPLDEYAPPDAEFWSRRLRKVETDVVCVGHTHQPYVLEVDDKLVINPGSVGLPRDGDPRASYAIIENYKVDVKRVEYPVEETVSVIQASPLPDDAKDMLAEVLRTGAAPHGVARIAPPDPTHNVPHGEGPPSASQNGDRHPASESSKVQ
jgi:hypothetical protein